MTNETHSMFNPVHFPQPILISVNGVQLEVFEAGKQNAGKPIVLCHGFPEHAFSWRHQVQPLVAAGYHVIIPNQRGYGNSSRPAEVTEYDIEHLAGDLVALLDAAFIESFPSARRLLSLLEERGWTGWTNIRRLEPAG